MRWSLFDFCCAALELHLARMRPVYISLGLAVLVAATLGWYVLLHPSSDFPVDKVVTIEKNTSLSAAAQMLEEEGVVSSSLLFTAYLRLTGRENSIQAGPYAFKEPYGLAVIAHRLTNGISGVPLVRIRVEEGKTAREIGELLEEKMPEFDHAEFDEKARALEGYLFPDTYLILPEETADDILQRFYNNFADQTATIEDEIVAFDHPLRDVLTMASLLEREARTLEEKRIVAGILWHRIAIGMPLQVDAVFGYIKDTQTYNPTFSDLAIDSLYNTYLYKGLPPGPIANPGLDSILAAVTPQKTDALYYLHDRNGVMRVSRTFEEHKANRARYLD